jgi:Tol biopolymer transport system component
VRLRYVMTCLALGLAAVPGATVDAGAQAKTFQIVFQSDRSGNSDLWLVDSDGANERPLTQTPTPEATPSWSPDGKTIVYACAPEAEWDLCTINPFTGQVTQLTKTPEDEFDPRYTADGKQIVMETYPTGANADIAIMPATGGVRPKPLMTTPNVDDQDPAPDPNSTRIAFASGGNIAILDTSAPGRVSQVTSGSRGDSDPSFSSHDEIAFASPTARTRHIVVAGSRVQNRMKRRLTEGAGENLEPAWTVDGTTLFFTRAELPGSRQFRIFRMDASGRNLKAVTKGGDYADTEPAPQPVSRGPLLPRTSRLAVQAAACRVGGNGNDRMRGTSRPDCIHGGPGNDLISGGGGRDLLFGDSGNDLLFATDNEHDLVDGGPGADEAWIDDGLDTHRSTTVH